MREVSEGSTHLLNTPTRKRRRRRRRKRRRRRRRNLMRGRA
jgi:hypothetical protein